MKKRIILFITILLCAINIPMSVLAVPKQMPDGEIFDAEYYAQTYPDIVNVLGNDENVLYNHYKNYGQAEGRLPYSVNDSTIVLNALNQVALSNGKISFNDAYAQLKESEKYAKVVCTNKESIPQDISNWIFFDYVRFTLSITNTSAKDIKGIEGNLIVYDLFGNKIVTIECNLTGNTIKSGETIINDKMSVQCNPYISYHSQLFNEKYSDLIFDYKIKSILYTDGSVINP